MPHIKRTYEGYEFVGRVTVGEFGVWVVNAYGFLIKVGESVSFDEFAQRIKSAYSLDNPVNNAAHKWAVEWSRLENGGQ